MLERHPRTLLAVLGLIALVLITLDYRDGASGPIAALQRGATAVVAPLQDGFAAAVRPIGSGAGWVAGLLGRSEENARLRTELAEARRQLGSQEDLRRRITDLEAQLGIREQRGLETVGARVVASPPGVFEFSVLIDAGARQGVQPDMAVVNGDGLVGKVVEVTNEQARVQLLSDPQAGYGVRIAGSDEQALLTGRGTQPFQLSLLDPEAEVAGESEVVTQTFTGSAIPDGLPVGEVVGGPLDGVEAQRLHQVRPYVDFTRLGVVQVVLDATTQPSELPEEETLAVPPVGPEGRPEPLASPAPEG